MIRKKKAKTLRESMEEDLKRKGMWEEAQDILWALNNSFKSKRQ